MNRRIVKNPSNRDDLEKAIKDFLLFGEGPLPDISIYGQPANLVGVWIDDIQKSDLKFWTLRFKTKTGSKPRVVGRSSRNSMPVDMNNVIWLRRIDEKPVVSVIQITQHQTIELNPEALESIEKDFHAEIDYGPIPNICDMTEEQADRLWATTKFPAELKDTAKTYSLQTSLSETIKIEVKFLEGVVSQYRVLADTIEDSSWHSVKK